MTGVDYDTLDSVAFVNMCYSAIVDDVVSVGSSRYEARVAVDKEIANNVLMAEGRLRARREQRQQSPDEPQVAQPLQLSSDLIYTAGLRPPRRGGDT
jgi:hypothetical protein